MREVMRMVGNDMISLKLHAHQHGGDSKLQKGLFLPNVVERYEKNCNELEIISKEDAEAREVES